MATYPGAYPQIDPYTGLPIDEQYLPPYSPPVPAPAPPRGPDSRGIITNEEDPTGAARQDRQYSYQRGDELDQEALERQNQYINERSGYTGQLQDLYDPLMYGRGGVQGEELDRILQQQQLSDLNMTPEEAATAGLTPEEESWIKSDPNNRRKYFNPNYENEIFGTGAGYRRAEAKAYGKELNEAFDPNVLRSGGEFYDELGGGVSDYAGRARGILGSPDLEMSSDIQKRMEMTPEEQQRIVEGAALTTGTRDKAAIAEAERRSRAAGMNPLGVAALRARGARSMNADAADAMTQARIGASNAAADRLKGGEEMRLRYGQNLAGMQSDAERAIADADYRAIMGGEQTRLGSERDIATRRTAAVDAAARARLKEEQDLAREGLALQQNITRVGNEAERDVDDTQSARASDVAMNRQDTARYVQGQRYGRGLAASDRLSDRYRYGADTRRADAAEGRRFVSGMQDQANANAQAEAARRQSLYGTQVGAGQGATGRIAQIEQAEASRPKWYDKVIGGVLGAADVAANFYAPGKKKQQSGGAYADGGIVTEPTYAMIGENGPEMIVPLNGQPGAQVPPSMALRMGQPPPFDTAPPIKPRAAYSQQYRYAG